MTNSRVWKYELGPVDEVVEIAMPVGAEPLYVALQRDSLCLWMRVDPVAPVVDRSFRIAGTGHANARGDYVGSVMLDGGALVFHVFDLGEAVALRRPFLGGQRRQGQGHEGAVEPDEPASTAAAVSGRLTPRMAALLESALAAPAASEPKGWWEWRHPIWHWFGDSDPGTPSACGYFQATGYTQTPGMSLADTCADCREHWLTAHPTAKPCPSGMHFGLMSCGCAVPEHKPGWADPRSTSTPRSPTMADDDVADFERWAERERSRARETGAGLMNKPPRIEVSAEDLIDASSLGSPTAKAIRGRTPRSVVEEVKRRIAEREEPDG